MFEKGLSNVVITCVQSLCLVIPVILLPAKPASFAHNFVSGMQSFYFGESKDAIGLQTCHNLKIVFRTHKFTVGSH